MRGAGGGRGHGLYASVFLVSFSVLAFEVSLTRIFSVIYLHHYTFLIVSGTICGLGIGGFLRYLLGRAGSPKPWRVGWSALVFALLIPVSVTALFGTSLLLSSQLWTAAIPMLPFIFAGSFLAGVFRDRPADSGRLYQADLAGAALGALIVVPLIGLTGPLHLAFLLGALAALGAVSWAAHASHRVLLQVGLASLLVLLGFWPLSVRSQLLELRPFVAGSRQVAKVMLRDLAVAGARAAILDSDWSAYVRTDLVRHDLPNVGAYNLELYTDGENPSAMIPLAGDLGTVAHLREALPYLAFDLAPRQSLLSVGPGGGVDFIWGMLAGFRSMEGAEINGGCMSLMERYQNINGGLYLWPNIRVTVEDGRSFVCRSPHRYDLIVCCLTQSATTGNLGVALTESYIHTQEAFADYFHHLTGEGRYALVVQSRPLLLRAAFTAVEVMEKEGIEAAQAWSHLLAVSLPNADAVPSPHRYLLIWKRSPVTSEDIAAMARAAENRVAVPMLVPGLAGDPMLDRIARSEIDLYQVYAAGLYEEGIRRDLRPVTDDRPYFLDLSFGVPKTLQWLLVGSLAIAAVFSGTFLLLRPGGGPPTHGWLGYFSALGVGFMLIEIPLIQKFILLLGHPTPSLAATLFYLLLGASLGSRLSQRWTVPDLSRRAALACLAVCLLVVLYVATLHPCIGEVQTWPRITRFIVLGVFLLPLGLALGIPFPSGIRMMSVGHQPDIPWMWGANGVMSVTGSALVAAGGKTVGFDGCLLAAAVIYAALFFALRRRRRGLGGAEGRIGTTDPQQRGERNDARDASPVKSAPKGFPIGFVVLLVALAALDWLSLTRLLPRAGPGGRPPLHEAALKGQTQLAASLLARGADVNARDERCFGVTPLHQAALGGHTEVAGLLLSSGADVNARADSGLKWTSLHEAAFAGHLEVAERLLRHGADVNARDDRRRTPLYEAAMAGHGPMTELLLSSGADISAPDERGFTPLHIAAWSGQTGPAVILLAHQADPDAVDAGGATPLHMAAWRGHREVVELLLASGAGLSAKDEAGFTPLHVAAHGGRVDVTSALIAAGADPNAQNKDGMSVFDLARQLGRRDLEQALRRGSAGE